MYKDWLLFVLLSLGAGFHSEAVAALNDADALARANESIGAIQSGGDVAAEIEKLNAVLKALAADTALDTRLRIHGGLSLAYFYQRDLQGQREQADILMALTEGMETLWRADAIGMRAGYLAEAGRTEESLAVLEQELQLRRKLPRATSKLSNALINIGIGYAELGFLELAMERLEEALEYSLEFESDTDVPDTVRTNMGYVLGVGKQFAAAVAMNEQVVASGRARAPNTAAMANRLANLAKMQMAIGLHDEAALALQEADAILTKVAPDSIDRARTLAGLSELSRHREDWRAAIDYSRGSWERSIQQSPHTIYECIAGRILALTLLQQPTLAQGDLQEAQRILERVEPLSRRLLPGSAERASLLFAYGLLAEAKGEEMLAIERLEAAVEVLNIQYALLGDDLLTQASFSDAFAELFDRLAMLYLSTSRPAAALDIWEQFRSRQVSDRLQLDALLRQESGGSEYLQARQELRDRAASIIASMQPLDVELPQFIDNRSALAALAQEQRLLAQQAAAEQPRLGMLLSQAGLETTARLRDLGAPTVYFAVAKERGFALLLLPATSAAADTTLKVFSLPGQSAIRAANARLRALLATPDSKVEALQSASADLFDMLWKPLQVDLDGVSRVIVVADDVLHGLPFGVLYDAETQQYLLQQHAISAATSLRNIGSAPVGGADHGRHFAGIAYSSPVPSAEALTDVEPAYERRDARGGILPRLRFAVAEVQQAARFFAPRTTLLLEQSATEQAVSSLGDTDVLHFAAHVVLNHAEPLNSFLALAPTEYSDGELRLGEVMQELQLDVHLVVLSACDSAVGPLYAGEGIVGLSSAFAYAGAKQVLATQWPVFDGVSARFMNAFYQAMARERPAVEALRDVQLQALSGRLGAGWIEAPWQRLQQWWRTTVQGESTVEVSHPYYWAPYVLTQSRVNR